MLCTEWCLVKTGREGITVAPIYCRSWHCEVCRPRRKRDVANLAAAGNPTTFITLTVNPALGADRVQRARALVTAWREIVREAKRKYGYKHIAYMAVFEATKAGEPHLHILARLKWIDQAWLSDQMRAKIGAPVVDIRRVRSVREAARYVSKYIGKAPAKFGTLKRYWHTLDWRNPDHDRDARPMDAPDSWQLRKMPVWQYVADAELNGYVAAWSGDACVLKYDKAVAPWWRPPQEAEQRLC